MPVELLELATGDPDEAEGMLNAIYATDRPLRFSGDPRDFACELQFATAGVLGSDHVRHTMSTRVAMDPVDFFLAVVVRGGTYDEFTIGDQTLQLHGGDVVVYPQDHVLEAAWDDVDVVTLRLERAVLERVGREHLGYTGTLRFTDLVPVSEARAGAWRQLTTFVHRQLLAEDSMLGNPLIEAQVAELIAGTALVTFENSAMTAGAPGGRVIPAPPTVRRAVAFIEDNADRPLTLSEIAESVGVTPRALQYGFARHLDMTPMAYLRRIRLEHAHRALQAANPAAGVTVAVIAQRWGFAHAGRFAAAYRARYGRSPSAILNA
jgi:AraC-like DNA-binding protein